MRACARACVCGTIRLLQQSEEDDTRFSLIYPGAPGGRNGSDLSFSGLSRPVNGENHPRCVSHGRLHQNTILSVLLCLLPLVVTLKLFPSSLDSSSLSRLFIGTKKTPGAGGCRLVNKAFFAALPVLKWIVCAAFLAALEGAPFGQFLFYHGG